MESQQPSAPPPEPRPPQGGRFVMFLKVLYLRLRFVALMVVVGLVAANWESLMNHYDRLRRPAEAPKLLAGKPVEYFCPMHPQVVRDEPGNCPICGMPLSQREKVGPRVLPDGVLAEVQLTPRKMRMGRIAVSPVDYHLLARETRTFGVIDYDQTRQATISARFKGRLDKLMVNYLGQKVSAGDPLAEIYSPELVVAQEELLMAVREAATPGGSTASGLSAKVMVTAARRKLQLWGMTDKQIDQVIKEGKSEEHVTLYSPIAGIVTEKKALEGRYVNEGEEIYTIADLGRVWLQAKIFESDLAGIREGAAVEVTSTAYPNEIFAGKIAFLAFSVDPATRTVSARVEVDNAQYKLRPGMYATGTIRLPVGSVVEASSETAPSGGATSRPMNLPTVGVAKAYLALTASLAADKADPALVKALADEAGALADKSPAARELAAAAKAAGDTLLSQRQALHRITEAAQALLSQLPPEGISLSIAHCPMPRGGDWLMVGHDEKDKRNPYYGSEMLTCGEIVGPLKTIQQVQADPHYAAGYYCPIYPDKLYDKPESCPLDKFPLKYMRVEKVLAVPESAVIDTGTRKIVYRQSSPGVFDMIEVKLLPRAGEFYPVLEGLKEGDEVATRGAFLVDAESRLNPSASAQYFGSHEGHKD